MNRRGLDGFVRPTVEPVATVEPIAYTSNIGFAKRPIQPVLHPQPTSQVDLAPEFFNDESYIPFYDSSQQYTSEQIRDMMGRENEFVSDQFSEGGEGIDEDLEFDAGDINATEKVIDDFATGDGLPTEVTAPTPQKEIGPLIVLGALAYFLL